MSWHATIIVLFIVLVAGGVGLPFPEDLTLLGAGGLARPGLLRLTDVVLAGFAGVVTADWILYGIGRCYGAEIVGHPRLGRLLGAHRIEAVRGAVMRHQARAVFFARFVLGTRIVTFLAAGTFGVSAVRFALAEAAGSVIFVPAMATFGYLFTDRALRIVHGCGARGALARRRPHRARALPPRVACLGGADAARRRRPARLRSATSRCGRTARRSATIPASAALKIGAFGLLLMGGRAAVAEARGAVEDGRAGELEVLQTPRAWTTATNITAPMNAMTMLPRKPLALDPRKLITMPPMNAPTIPMMHPAARHSRHPSGTNASSRTRPPASPGRSHESALRPSAGSPMSPRA